MDEITPPAVSAVVTVTDEVELVGFWNQHRFFLLIGGVIVVSLIFVVISLVIYNVSGAAQLDLSRPGYQSVSAQVEQNDGVEGFDAAGEVTVTTIDEFLNQYDEQATRAKAVDAYNGDPLNPELLEFSESVAAE